MRIEKDEDDHQSEWHDELQFLGCTLQIFKLPGPGDRISGGKLDALTDQLLCLRDVTAEIAAADVDVDPAVESCIFAAQLRRTIGDDEIGHGAQRRRCARFGDDREHAQLVDRVTQLAWITHVDWQALQAFDRLADVLAADRERHDLLYVSKAETKTRGTNTVDTHFHNRIQSGRDPCTPAPSRAHGHVVR